MKISHGITSNLKNFGDLSENIGASRHGETLELPLKQVTSPNKFGKNNRNIGNLTRIVGNTGERMVRALFPGAKSLSKNSPFDLELPSGYDEDTVLMEVKTAQRRNRGVIRPYQIDGYKNVQDNTRIYIAQIFYQMRSGRIPSEVPESMFQREFFPLVMYVFPINFVIYLTNTVPACGNHEDTKFYALTEYRARTFYQNADSIEGKNKFQSAEFTTNTVRKNTEMPLCVVDHIDTPHILESFITL